jgi:hypothetical protein
LRPAMLAAYLTLIPFAFYWLVIYKGVNTESLPRLGEGAYYNIRFGLAMIPAVALFAAVLTTVGPQLLRRALVGTSLVAVTIAGVTGLILSTPFVLREAVAGYGGDTRRSGQSEAEWLSSQYRGGDVLYTYGGEAYVMFYLLTEHKFADGSFITAANGAQFARAEAHPERWVTWIITNVETGKPQEPQDPLWKSFYDRSDWRRYFVLRRRFTTHVLPRGGAYGTTEFYERIGPSKGPPLGLQERSDIASYRLRAELRGELGSHGGSNGPAIPASDATTWNGWKQQGREANEALRKLREEVLLCGRTADPLGALGVSSFVWPVAVRC